MRSFFQLVTIPVLLAGLVGPAWAQAGPRSDLGCWPASQHEARGPILPAESDPAVVAAASDSVAHRLAGHYTLLEIWSEGAPRRLVLEAELELARPDSGTIARWHRTIMHGVLSTGRLAYPLAGTIRWIRSTDLATGAPTPDFQPSSQEVRITYRPLDGSLRLDAGPVGVLDSGTPYDIFTLVADRGFIGRWQDGGIAMALLPSPYGLVGERANGYFCAWRRRP